MIISMTGFSKTEATESGATATVELKSLNGRYLEINCRMPKILLNKELELRDIIRKVLSRGNVQVSVTLDADETIKPFAMDENIAADIYHKLVALKKKLKIREAVRVEHVLNFSGSFMQKENDENAELYWKLVKKALRDGLKNLERMRKNEGNQIAKDIRARINKIKSIVNDIETLGIDRIPEERDRLRQRIAQLFESDEIDEQRLQMEMVIMADKLDISEECVRLKSHIKFFFEALKAKEPVGRKINFLLQEMHREINTIGSKINDAKVSQLVVNVKEELEKVREQVQNIE